MDAELEVVKFAIEDIITTSNNETDPTLIDPATTDPDDGPPIMGIWD